MTEVVIFNLIQAVALVYAFRKGGAPERVASALLLLASLATLAVPTRPSAFQTVFWSIFWIDLCLLVGLTALAALADRFWPVWIAACQFITVAVHGVRAYDPRILAPAYWALSSSIAYPMLAMLVVGTWRHQRRLPLGTEFAWTVQRHRHEQVTTRQATLR